VDVDEREHVLALTRALVAEVLEANRLAPDDVISLIFSATRDLSSVAPALAARQLGMDGTALLCLQEMFVVGSMPQVIRLIAHVETDRTAAQLQHVYHRGTHVLRSDIPPVTVEAAPEAGSVDPVPEEGAA
jgi:chorismate mutase